MDVKDRPLVVDMHVHPYMDMAHALGSFWQYESIDDFMADLKRAGIDKVCGSVFSYEPLDTMKSIRMLNDEALRIWQTYPDTYIPGIHVHPLFPRESCEELGRMHEAGVRMVGELLCYKLGCAAYAVPDAYSLYEYMAELDMILNLHPSTHEDLDRLVRDFPRLTVIAAHPGAKENLDRHLDRLVHYDNAYLDLSGTGLYQNGLVRYCLDRVGKEKILFGSDFPIVNPAMYLSAVLFERLTDTEREAVLSGNFIRLYRGTL